MMKTPAIDARLINSIPVLLSSGTVAAAVYFYGWNHYFSPVTLGVIAGGLVDLDNALTGRLKNLLFTVLAFTVSSLAVQTTFDHPLSLTVTFTALAFVFTMFGAAGERFRTIAFGTLAVAVYTCLSPRHADEPLYLNPLLILCGTLLYSGSSVLVHILFPHRPVQENMAAAYAALSGYLEAKAEFFDPDEIGRIEQQQIDFAMANSKVVEVFNRCRNSLFYRMKGQHRHPRTARMLRYYFVAQDIHERISSSNIHYADFVQQMRHTDLIYRLYRLLRLQAAACRDFAAFLRNETAAYAVPPKLERATRGADAALEYYAGHLPENAVAPYRVQRLLDTVTHISRQMAYLGNPDTEDLQQSSDRTRIHTDEIRSLKEAWQTLKTRNSVQDSVFRHAVRMALIACVCCVLIHVLQIEEINGSDLSLGFWILLTAIFVCQPNYSATKKRLIQRILGTVCGVLVGGLLSTLNLTLTWQLLIAVLGVTLFFLFRTSKHSFSTFFITIQALMGLSIMGLDVSDFFLHRILDTLVGAGVAGAAVYFLWPDWKYRSLEKSAAAAITSNGGYLKAVLDELHSGAADHVDYRIARRRSHAKAAALSSMLSDMSAEADKHGSRLQDGFLLLKINYSLISYISALGAYRDKISSEGEEEIRFLHDFYPAALLISRILGNMNTDDETAFQAAFKELQERLEALRVSGSRDAATQNQVLWQQLVMIAELLQPCYRALHNEEVQPELQTSAA